MMSKHARLHEGVLDNDWETSEYTELEHCKWYLTNLLVEDNSSIGAFEPKPIQRMKNYSEISLVYEGFKQYLDKKGFDLH